MTIRQIIEFGPAYSTWANWNGNLLHYFGEETIPYIEDETRWQEVARNVVQLPTFMNYATPDPDTYTDWQKWAFDFMEVVNGTTR